MPVHRPAVDSPFAAEALRSPTGPPGADRRSCSRRRCRLVASRPCPRACVLSLALTSVLAPTLVTAARTSSGRRPKAHPESTVGGLLFQDSALYGPGLAAPPSGVTFGSLVESSVAQGTRPKGRGSNKKGKKTKKSERKREGTPSDSSAHAQSDVKEIASFDAVGDTPGTSVRCRDKSISVYIAAINQEITVGGEAMAQVVSHVCSPSSADNTTGSADRIFGALPGILRLMMGSIFLAASADPREGGCDLSTKIHGANVPVGCVKENDIALLRIGGMTSATGVRTGRQARPALEVAFRGEVGAVSPGTSVCHPRDMHSVLLQACGLLFMFFDESMEEKKLEFARSLYIIDGMKGRYPRGDGSEEHEEFVYKHVGACFHKALYNGTDTAFLNEVVSVLRHSVGSAKLLVAWEAEGSSWATTGVISEFLWAFTAVAEFAHTAMYYGLISAERPLCHVDQPSEESLAAELSDPSSARSIATVFKDKLAVQA